MAHPKHAAVRQRYGFACGYCSVSETDAGGELTVDHFQPVSAGGNESDENLVYACSRCNLFKGDFWPSPQDEEHGHRLLHPLRDHVTAHVHLIEQTGQLEALTETGRFHIASLQLNRPALVALRIRRRLISLLEAKKLLLETEVAQLRSTIEAQERYIVLLQTLLGLSPSEE